MRAAKLGDNNQVFVENTEVGDDELFNRKRFIPAGLEYKDIQPIETPGGSMPNCAVVLGNSGGLGDFLRSVHYVIRDPAYAAAYLDMDPGAPDLLSGTTGTNPTLAAAQTLTAASAATATADFYKGCVAYVEYTPTNAGRSIRVERRIATHGALSTTSVPLTLTHNIPAGATITKWGIRPRTCIEIAAYNQSGAAPDIKRQALTALGFRFSVDLGLQASVGGEFT